jgi:very-short-patch-repair endonuclease
MTLSGILTIDWLEPVMKINNKQYSSFDLISTLKNMSAITEIVTSITPDIERKKFGYFPSSSLADFERLVSRLDDARMPVIGYLFSKSVLREIENELRQKFEYSSEKLLSKQHIVLNRIANDLRTLHSNLTKNSITDISLKDAAFFITVRGYSLDPKIIETGLTAIDLICKALKKYPEEFLSLGIHINDFSSLRKGETIQRINEICLHISEIKKLEAQFLSIPELDYTAQLSELEYLQTQRLANTLDESVVRFANEKKNQAQKIKDIITKKQLFPKDLFKELQAAFPVMIAGIREYAEYIPLEKNLFDLIIIDEASQVSIAQALPAFIRGKKIIVLGDRNQFSNVKTERASIAINQSYKAQVIEQYKKQEKPDISQLNQINLFDIKTSVLQFVERISNYRIMLRKHFRGYPELIGFSSKYFYNNQLQAVKIRGRAIDQVIEFLQVFPDFDVVRNTNTAEANAIVKLLQDYFSEENAPECCIITPHSEQQKYISKIVNALPIAVELIDKLNLKIFTFDTCQGEEREIVIYSMVATETADRLNYIFAKELIGSDDVEESLRLQRLNVGFSRAKEKIIIVHSKSLDRFKGGIGIALNHYWNVLERSRDTPNVEDLDQSSPMERKVLGWLQQLPVLDELSEQVELDAQFELGSYLKQIDPNYSYPKYRVDFLLKVTGLRKSIQIIIEYDGFKEHFTDQEKVQKYNYEHYMRTEDVERQKILESYGYKFIRINRFNLGKDPIDTLDKRIRSLIKDVDVEYSPPLLIEEYKNLQSDLQKGDAKVCPECNHVRAKQMYFDSQLQNGKGGFGRICMECKGISATDLKNKGLSNNAQSMSVGKRIYLHCPFSQKDECKKLGGRWDPIRKLWYVNEGLDLTSFNRWL